MSNRSVYLAGPITGLSYDEAKYGWRKEFDDLMPHHIDCFSPMRYKSFLEGQGIMEGTPDMYFDSLFATAKGITTRDHFDVRNCDMVVANFLDTDRVSIGTCIEFGWAHALDKPVVMIIEPFENGEGATNLHHHAMLFEIAGYVVPSVEDAAHVVKAMLTPGV